MAVHDAYARLTPYELSFPDLGFARTHFAAIRREAEARQVDLGDQTDFVMLASTGQALREIRGPQDDPALIRQYGFLLYHAYHFCEAGEPLFLVPTARVRALLADDEASDSWQPALEPAAGYVQMPQHLVWVRAMEDAAPESLDGFFWARGRAGTFGLLFALGMRGDRPGLSVVPAPELPIEDVSEWTRMEMREGGGDFTSSMPGAEIDGLYELCSTGEALKLAGLVLRGLERGGVGESTAAAADGTGPQPTGLSYRTLS
ncbi:MAG: hypothetical protein EXR95_02540 [Gemmatimonadetes bacterium]|nr:hypothetical protein [Gemmatimonadota bacterium]